MYKTIQVVILPSNEKANIRFDGNNKLIYHQKELLGDKSQHLYFLNDEPIKEGDWFIDERNVIQKCISKTLGYIMSSNGNSIKNTNCKKIICSTDSSLKWYMIGFLPQPSQDFINYYVEQYNLGNVITEVEVEYNSSCKCLTCGSSVKSNCDYAYKCNPQIEYELKVNSKNEITIRKIKESWSKREVIELIQKYNSDFKVYQDNEKWISENL